MGKSWQRSGRHGERQLGPDTLGTGHPREGAAYESPPAELSGIYPFRRYLAAARGELPFETYCDEMWRHVNAEIEDQLWARRPEGRVSLRPRYDRS